MPELTPEVNLNAPCPCGSGRKYKRCCYANRKAELARVRQARHEAANHVLRFAEQRAPGSFSRCREAVLAPLRARFGPLQVDQALDRIHDVFMVNLVDSFLGDEPLEDGKTPIELFLQDPAAADLHPEARTHLEGWAAASLGLFEVEAVTAGESLHLKDLLQDREVRVAERTASASLEPWNVIVSRVATAAPEPRLTGAIYYIPRRATDWFRTSLEQDRERSEHGGLSWTEHLKRRWRLVPSLWIELMVGNPDLGHDDDCHDPDCGHEHHHHGAGGQ
jgi:hypothetical protein